MDQSKKSYLLRGTEPKYFYSGSDLMKRPPMSRQGGNISANKKKYEPTLDPAVSLLMNTQLCARFISKGYCNKRDCTFAHSEKELRPAPDLRRTKWCRLVFHGLVCHDELCPYAHTKEQLRSNAKDLVSYKTSYCKYYQKGNCLSGVSCRFAHGPQELRVPTDHPRCIEVREQLRDREIQNRRQQVRKEKASNDENNNTEVVTCTGGVQTSPPPGSPPDSTENNTTNRQEKNTNATQRLSAHTATATMNSNISPASMHPRKGAKADGGGDRPATENRGNKEEVKTFSRMSTRECLHAAEERALPMRKNSI